MASASCCATLCGPARWADFVREECAMTQGTEAGIGQDGPLNDLTRVMTQRGLQTTTEPRDIAAAVQAALLNELRLIGIVVRLTDPEGGPSIEMMRHAESLGDAGGADGFFACARLGLEGELGIVVAQSDRSDFPQE